MKNLNKLMGNIGEDLATNYIKKILKYKIIERNYSNKLGEIDIIAKNKNTICFVEVKLKSSDIFGRPSEMVNFRKQNKIKKVAEFYLKYNNLLDNLVRFDVCEVLENNINYIEDAFR